MAASCSSSLFSSFSAPPSPFPFKFNCLPSFTIAHIHPRVNRNDLRYSVSSSSSVKMLSAKASLEEDVSPQSTLIDSMQNKIKEQLSTDNVIIKDVRGDGRHVSIEVVSSDFEGKSSMNRQRMVYKAIWEELQSVVHAVDSMRTLTPEEFVQENGKNA